MAVIIHKSELIRRALVYIDEKRRECPAISQTMLIDEAGMKFNLSPADAAALERFFREVAQGKGTKD